MASPGPSEHGKKVCISLRVLRSVLMGRSSLIPCPSLAHLCYLELGGPKCRSGGLSITLGGPGGRVIGGCTGCLLISALPMQICFQNILWWGIPKFHYQTWSMHLLVWMAFIRLGHGSLFIAYQLGWIVVWMVKCGTGTRGWQILRMVQGPFMSYLPVLPYQMRHSAKLQHLGRFDILSVSGSFMLSEVAGQKSRTGGLSIALAGPDGRVLGDCVAGLLAAASPAQVIVGSFLPDGHKEAKTNYMEPSSASPKVYLRLSCLCEQVTIKTDPQ